MKTPVYIILFLLIPCLSIYAQDSAYGWYFEGNKQFFRKKYDEAILAYNKSIELDPNADYAFFNRGNAKFEQDNYKGARLDYNKTIIINKDYAEAYYGRGRTKVKLGDQDGGCKDLKIARKMEFKAAREAIEELCKD